MSCLGCRSFCKGWEPEPECSLRRDRQLFLSGSLTSSHSSPGNGVLFPLPKGLSDLCPLFSLGDLLHPPSLLLVSPLIPLPVHEMLHNLLHELSFLAKEKENVMCS